jgi:multidrug efflux pump subunit AcrA (membrane-fusion protein)
MSAFLRSLPSLLVLLLLAGCSFRGDDNAETLQLTRGPLEVWTPFQGRLEAANPLSLRAELDGLAKLTWIIDDGSPVEAGEPIARFDPSTLEEQKIGLERDRLLAENELRLLREARHPLEQQSILRERAENRSQLAREEQLLADTRELVNEALLAAGELIQQEIRVTELREQADALEKKLQLTRDILHPALEAQAEARLRSAQAYLERVSERLTRAEVLAPERGTVTLPWIPIDGERRPVRVGDGLYKNQVFLELADLTHLIVRCDLRERDLPLAAPGSPVRLRFPALPGRNFSGRVLSVSPRPRGGERVYPAEIQMDAVDPALRPGLSVQIDILTLREEDVLQVPRAALRFGPQGPETLVFRAGRWSLQRLETGPGNATHLLLRGGLEEGERLRAP